jgi:hypothetical protein
MSWRQRRRDRICHGGVVVLRHEHNWQDFTPGNRQKSLAEYSEREREFQK